MHKVKEFLNNLLFWLQPLNFKHTIENKKGLKDTIFEQSDMKRSKEWNQTS